MAAVTVLHKPTSACVGNEQSQLAFGYTYSVVVGVGSVKVYKGPVSISVVLRVLVVCQFGHIRVPHIVVGVTTCPAYCH